jgi:hypothetical protein
MFIDEVQEMGFLLQCLFFSYYQSDLIKQIALIGDEKQTIYRYLGASPIWFVNLKCDEKVTFPKTYRCPKKIWGLAKKIEHKMKEKESRIVKDNGVEGELQELTGVSFDYILGLLNKHKTEKSFLLFRTNSFENQFRQFLDSNQFVYKGLRRNSMFTDKLNEIHERIRQQYDDGNWDIWGGKHIDTVYDNSEMSNWSIDEVSEVISESKSLLGRLVIENTSEVVSSLDKQTLLELKQIIESRLRSL